MVQDAPPLPLDPEPEPDLEQTEREFAVYMRGNLTRWAIRWTIGFGVIWAITATTGRFFWLWYLGLGVALMSLGFHLLVGRAIRRKADHVRRKKAELDATIDRQKDGK